MIARFCFCCRRRLGRAEHPTQDALQLRAGDAAARPRSAAQGRRDVGRARRLPARVLPTALLREAPRPRPPQGEGGVRKGQCPQLSSAHKVPSPLLKWRLFLECSQLRRLCLCFFRLVCHCSADSIEVPTCASEFLLNASHCLAEVGLLSLGI